jgi:hypothetical protein
MKTNNTVAQEEYRGRSEIEPSRLLPFLGSTPVKTLLCLGVLLLCGCSVTRVKIDGAKVDAFRATLLTDQAIGSLDAQLGDDKSLTVGGVKMNQTKGAGLVAETVAPLR